MFTIDFTKPWLYKDIIYFNQGNLSTNNTLRCKLVTGGSDDFTGGSIACTFTTKDSVEISGFGKLIDAKSGIIDIVFPSNSLVVGNNKLEVLVNRADGGVAQSPPVMYDIWQGLTTGNGIEAETNYPILIELINSTNEASNKANSALNKANSMITDMTDAIDNAYRSANEADIATSKAYSKIEEVESAKVGMINKVDTEIANMKTQVNASTNTMTSKVDMKIADVDSAIASGTKDLEVKESRRDMDGVEHATLKVRLESDLKKGKVIEETKEGTYLSFNDTVGGLVSYLEVLGNTVQDVSNLANIRSSCIPNGDGTFKMSILSVGENLLNENEIIQDKYVDKNTGNIENSATYNCSPFVRINGGKDLFISKLYASSALVICFYDKNKKFISYIDQLSVCNKPFRSPANACYLVYTLSKDWANNIVSEGTVATPYTPYQETRCDIKLPCQLEKWDRLYFDKEENAWCVEKGNTKYFPDVSKLFNFTDLGTTVRVNHNASDALIKPSLEEGICNILPYDSNRKWEDDRESCYLLRSGIVTLKFNKSKISNLTIEGVRQYVKDIGLYIHYPTTTPQKIVLPQSEQIKLNSFVNKTHIYTISGDVDVTVKATVSKSLASTVQANTEEISKINNTIADMQGLKESQDFAYELPNGQNYLVCKDTQNGVVKDLKVYGRTKLVNAEGIEVEPGTDGATLISVGNGNEIEVSSINKNLVVECVKGFTIGGNEGSLLKKSESTTYNHIKAIAPKGEFYYKSKGTQYYVFFTDENLKILKIQKTGLTVLNNDVNASYIFTNIDSTLNYMDLTVSYDKYYTVNNIEPKQDKKTILFKDTDNTWKPILNLRGIDENNCDIVDSVNNVFESNIVEVTYNGSETNIVQNNAYPPINADLLRFDINTSYGSLSVLCDKFKFLNGNDQGSEEGIRPHTNKNLFAIYISKSKLETRDLAGFKKWLQSNNITLLYKNVTPKIYEINPIYPNSYENETMILIDSGVIAPHASWKITSSLPNFVKELSNQIKQLQDQVYLSNTIGLTVALNTLDTKLRLDRLEAPQQ